MRETTSSKIRVLALRHLTGALAWVAQGPRRNTTTTRPAVPA